MHNYLTLGVSNVSVISADTGVAPGVGASSFSYSASA